MNLNKIKKSLEETRAIQKGAPVGNRNAAKDHSATTAIHPDVEGVQMVGRHLDYRELGERGLYGMSDNEKIPQVGEDMDFYDTKGEKLSGRITAVKGDTFTIKSKEGEFKLRMVNEKTGHPIQKSPKA